MYNKLSTVKHIVPNRLLNSVDVALVLNISRSQAYLLMRDGTIPSIRFGRSVRVRPEDLRSFIERNVVSMDGLQNDSNNDETDTQISLEGEDSNELLHNSTIRHT